MQALILSALFAFGQFTIHQQALQLNIMAKAIKLGRTTTLSATNPVSYTHLTLPTTERV